MPLAHTRRRRRRRQCATTRTHWGVRPSAERARVPALCCMWHIVFGYKRGYTTDIFMGGRGRVDTRVHGAAHIVYTLKSARSVQCGEACVWCVDKFAVGEQECALFVRIHRKVYNFMERINYIIVFSQNLYQQ